MRSTFAHVKDESPMVAEAVLLKSALLAHTLGAAPQTEASAPPQQADAAAHAIVWIVTVEPGRKAASHAAASLAAFPREDIHMRSTFAHVKDESPMVAEAVLLKSVLLAHTLGAAPQTESAPPQQSRAAAHANELMLVPDEETAAHVAASLAALPRQYFQVRSTFAHVKVVLPMVVLAALSKSAPLAQMVPVAWVPAASATTRRRILGIGRRACVAGTDSARDLTEKAGHSERF